jgi:nitroreductase
MASHEPPSASSAEGLYSHYIAGFNPEHLYDQLGIPEGWTLLTLGFFGHPGDPLTLTRIIRSLRADLETAKKAGNYFREKWSDN